MKKSIRKQLEETYEALRQAGNQSQIVVLDNQAYKALEATELDRLKHEQHAAAIMSKSAFRRFQSETKAKETRR